MRLYSLAINGVSLVEVDVETPAWLPVKPRLSKRWLRGVVTSALRHYLATTYLEHDKSRLGQVAD